MAERPDRLLAMGSYSSVGPVLAARIYHIPVFLHEGNAVPGRAIKFLAKFADKIAIFISMVLKNIFQKPKQYLLDSQSETR